MYTINFGTTCRKLRRKRKLSQEQLAEAVGVATSSISRIERGSFPHPNHEARIIEKLGIKEFHESLVFGKGYAKNLEREKLENKFIRTAWGGDADAVGKIIEEYDEVARKEVDVDMKKLLFMQQIWFRMLGDTQTSDIYEQIGGIRDKGEVIEEEKIKETRVKYLDQMIMNHTGIAYYEEGNHEEAYKLFKKTYCKRHE